MARFVAYYRVSTEKQGRSGLGLEAQKKAVCSYVNECGGKLIAEFLEVESGARNDRPQLDLALRTCRKEAATLIIGKLDRLARSVAFIAGLMEGRVEFVACDMPQANKLTVHIMAAMAEYEREMIGQRTRLALAAARERGVKLGSKDPIKLSTQGVKALKTKADANARNGQAVIQQLQRTGIITYSALATALNARGLRAPRGGIWHAETVRRVINRSTVTLPHEQI